MPDIDLGHSPAWLLLCLAVALAGTLLLYGWRLRRVAGPRWLRWLLAGLRGAGLFLLAWLLLEPVVSQQRRRSEPPRVALLVDDSRSMTAAGDTAFVRAQLPAQVAQLAARLQAAGAAVDLFRVSAALDALPAPDSLRFQGEASALADALDALAARYYDRNLAAAVLISDGIPTSGESPALAADRLSVPLFTAWSGDTTRRRDLRIEAVQANEVTYLETLTPLRVTARADGFPTTETRVQVRWQGKLLAQQTLRLPPDIPVSVDLPIRLDQPGLQAVDVLLDARPGEYTLRNNRQRVYLRVLENRQRILVLAGAPHPDIGALQQAFRDPRFHLHLAVRRNPGGEFYQALTPEILREASLVVLHNFPATAADRAVLAQVAEQVRARNLPVFSIVGLGYEPGILPQQADIVGVQAPGGLAGRSQEAELALAPAYRQHATYTFDDGFADWLAQVPPLLVPEADWQPAAGAAVYGNLRIKGFQVGTPMLLLREQGQRKSLVLLGENLWRWRLNDYARNGRFEYFDTWMQNLVQWLTVRADRRRFKVAPAKPRFGPGERIGMKGEVYDEVYRPLAGADIALEVRDSAGRATTYRLTPGLPGNYGIELPNLPEGTYTYTATGTRNGLNLGRDRGSFTVGASTVEFRQLRADANLMRQLAVRTGGSSVPAPKLLQLADSIVALPTLRPVVSTAREATPAYRLWLPLLLALALFSTEWVLRKRYGEV